MRVPTAERRRFRVRGWIIAFAVVLLVLLFSLRGLAGFFTDYLWFDSLGQGDTWGSLLAAKVVPALVFTVIFFAILFVNLVIADRLAPRFRGDGRADAGGRARRPVPGDHRLASGVGSASASRCSSP